MTSSRTSTRSVVLTQAEVDRYDERQWRQILQRAVDAGFNDVIAEVLHVPDHLATATHSAGMTLKAGLTCFHETTEVNLSTDPSLWPIDCDGRRRSRLEWYTGLVPTSQQLQDRLLARAEEFCRDDRVSGIVLDFVRWPLHWELECRDNGPRLPECSFDSLTLRAFNAWAGTSLDTQNASAASELLLASQSAQWTRFRCDVITEFIEHVSLRVRPSGKALAAFVVPLSPEQQRRRAGQDIAAWTPFVDEIYVMTYHRILHEQPAWIGDVLSDLQPVTTLPTHPVYQVTSDPEWAGDADWGPPLTPHDFANAVSATQARTAGTDSASFAVFPGSALGESHYEALADALVGVSQSRGQVAPS